MGAAILSFPGAEFTKEHRNEAEGLQRENDTQRHVRKTILHFKRNRNLKFIISGSLAASFSLEGGLLGSETHQFLLPLMAEGQEEHRASWYLGWHSELTHLSKKADGPWGFPGGPVVRTPVVHCRGHGLDP